MKRKGINPLEQHVEKLVVGVFLAGAAGVFALQIVKPATVSVDKDRVSPQRAYERVSARADEVGARLRTDRLPDGLPEAPADVAADLEKRLRAPALPTQSLVGAVGRPNSGLAGGEGPGGAEGLPTYALLEPPATGKPVAGEYRATLDPLVVAAVPELASLLPASQPYDVRVVSVSARFPTDVLVQRLSEDPDGAGPAQAPPRFWWLNSMGVLDVRLEREEQREDGSWGAPTLVPALPAQYSLRAELDVAGRDLGQSLRDARTRMADLAQPRFYATIAGPNWAPPSVSEPVTPEAAPSADVAADIARKKRNLEQLEARIKTQQESLDKPTTITRPGGSSTPSSGPGRIGGGGTGGMARIQPSKSDSPSQTGGGSGAPAQASTPEDRRKEALQASIARLEKERDALAAEIASLEGQAAGPGAGAAPPADFAVRALESGEPFAIWAHDLTAQAGKTYRYRTSVVITNPLYGNARSMAEASRPLASKPAVASPASEWSEPIRVLPDAVVFFTSARGTGLGGEREATATAEVYRFHYGYWRGRTTTLRPGDALFAEVDVPELPLFEVGTGSDGAKVVGTTAGPTRLTAGIPGGFVVDVLSTPSEGPGGREQVWQVVYRDASGRLVVVTPGSGSADPVRREVEASLAAGKSASVREPGSVSPSESTEATTPAPGAPRPPTSPGLPAGLGG